MQHYAKQNTWTSETGPAPTACGAVVDKMNIRHFPHMEDFLDTAAGHADICPACMRALWEHDRAEVILYIIGRMGTARARKAAHAQFSKCTGE
jgi:hypothetical protein